MGWLVSYPEEFDIEDSIKYETTPIDIQADINDAKLKLQGLQPGVEKLRIWRDKYYAHNDRDYFTKFNL